MVCALVATHLWQYVRTRPRVLRRKLAPHLAHVRVRSAIVWLPGLPAVRSRERRARRALTSGLEPYSAMSLLCFSALAGIA